MRSTRPRRRFRPGGARPPTQVVVDYLSAHADRFGVEPICRVLSEHGLPIAPSVVMTRLWRAARCFRGTNRAGRRARRWRFFAGGGGERRGGGEGGAAGWGG